MAQLVEHNLAKVGVAGSSPVVRSIAFPDRLGGPFSAKWPSGKAEACNFANVGVAGSSPVVRSKRSSPTTTVAGLFRTHRLGSNPRGSERFGSWLWRCLPRMSALGV